MSIYDEIRMERRNQDAKWGGAKHDDTHTDEEWLNFIEHHLWRAYNEDFAWRKQMLRVAALVVAAIESSDRVNEAAPAGEPQPQEPEEYSREAFERDSKGQTGDELSERRPK